MDEKFAHAPAAELAHYWRTEGEIWKRTVLAKSFIFSGERGRNRTFNLLIKSQLLCQLSYAPTKWGRG